MSYHSNGILLTQLHMEEQPKEEWEQDLDWLMTESENAKNETESTEKQLSSSNEEIIDMPRTATDEEPQVNGADDDEEDDDAALGIYEDDEFDEDEEEDDLYPVQSEEVQRNTLLNDAPESDEYDLQLKLEQANEELANTEIDEREPKLKFKPKLIDFEAPADDYSSDEDARDADGAEDSTEKVSEDLNNISLKDEEESSPAVVEEMVEINGQKVKKTEKILIERDGKFELVEVGELEGILPPIAAASNGSGHLDAPGPAEPIKRPTSAPVQSSFVPHPPTTMHSRPRSAANDAVRPNRKDTRTFRYSSETKEIMKKRHEARMQRQREDEKRRKAEDEMKREEAESAWKAWLETKNKEAKERRREEKAAQKQAKQKQIEEQKRSLARDAYQTWVKEKKVQIKHERIQVQQRQMEEDEKWFVRDRGDCNRAFRSWLRRKNEEAQKARDSDRVLRKQSRRMARQARRARKLLDALREAQEMKYIEYYGYRF